MPASPAHPWELEVRLDGMWVARGEVQGIRGWVGRWRR
jgi:hypothetical protein